MKKSPQNNHYRWIWIYAAVIVLLAGIINLLMWLPIPTFGSLSETSWLGFWGSYLGGALGCAPAIAALQENRLQSKRQFEKEQLDRRISVMPVFDCQILDCPAIFMEKHSIQGGFIIDNSGILRNRNIYDDQDYYSSDTLNYLKLSNCGLGPALKVKLSFSNSSVDLFSLRNNVDPYYFWFVPSRGFFKNEETVSRLFLRLTFCDIFGNAYSQELIFKCHYSFEGNNHFMQFDPERISQPEFIESKISEE